MHSPKYEVRTLTDILRSEGQEHTHRFSLIEIMPPVTKEVAGMICNATTEYMQSCETEDTGGHIQVDAISYGHCDEGATVNTVIRFTNAAELSGNPAVIDQEVEHLTKMTQNIISPTGMAIAQSYSN